MSDKKISQLTALSAANLAPSTDVLAIVDTSATETKKIVAQDLINGVLNVASAVGIGTASPGSLWNGANRLVVGSGSAAAGLTIYTSTSTAGTLAFGDGTTGSDPYVGYVQYNHTDNTMSLGTSGTTKATLDASGNLGVGTTSPSPYTGSSRVIHVDGGANAAEIKLTNNASGASGVTGLLLTLSGTAGYLWNVENDFLSFGTNNTERGRFTAGGIALFGKTNDYSLGTQPGYVIANAVLSVASDNTGSANNRNWAMATNGYENGSFDFASSSANNTWANDAYRMSITRAGSTYNTTGTYGTLTSDERLKQDIADASSQWDDMKAIRFRKFRMKAEVAAEGDNAVVRLGVIAQEAAATSPNLVTRRVANEHDIRVVPELEKQEVLGFKDSVLFWKAAKALQEAMARIESLEADMAALKGAK